MEFKGRWNLRDERGKREIRNSSSRVGKILALRHKKDGRGVKCKLILGHGKWPVDYSG